MTSNIKLNIEIAEPKWESIPENLDSVSEDILYKTFEFIDEIEDLDFLEYNKTVNISLCLSNDEEIRKLNNSYREKDCATNVLSFAGIDSESFYSDIEIFDEIELGDIIIAFDTVEKEAKEKNIPFMNHYKHLLIHGILHLLGFDHIENDEAEYMEECEINILKNLNIDNPYTE